ncbi:MAG: GNAT family protein [Chloroflexota bacterium]
MSAMSDERDRPVVNIQGPRVALGPWRRDLVPLYHRWDNDFDLRRSDDPSEARPVSLEEAQNDYDQWATSGAARRVRFTVYEVAGWTPIGMANVRDLDWHNQTGVLGISIAEANYRGKGYGTEATQLVLDFAFTVMGLHNVMLDVLATNQAGLRAYSKAGFREIGRRRESSLINKQRYDIVYMDCLAQDFVSPVLARVFAPESERN